MESELQDVKNRGDYLERAKQFMPFDALKGFREALKEKEKVIVSKIELSDYAKEILDERMRQVRKRDVITVVYYNKGQYQKITGMVSSIDVSSRIIKIVNKKIAFVDIYDLQREESF